MQYKTDNVFEAVWVGCALLAYKTYLEMQNQGKIIDNNCLWFSQTEIRNKAQELSSKTVQNARAGQWTNGDHSNNYYNYLRENGKFRRLVAHGEFQGNKEIPEDLSNRKDYLVTISGEIEITIAQLIDWVNNEYTNTILGEIPPIEDKIHESITQTPEAKVIVNTLKGYDHLDISPYLTDFLAQIRSSEIEIYNEFSVQFELALFLRERVAKQYKIQLERNINFFGLVKSSFLKKEMDTVIFNESRSEKHCIEIKFPNNGQYPEQMFSICKDIKFLEQLQEQGFTKCYELVIVSSDLYHVNKGGSDIYDMFRKDKLLRGRIVKPTGQRDEELILSNEYRLEWLDLIGNMKGLVIEV